MTSNQKDSFLKNFVDPQELREVALAARVEIATKVGRLAQRPDSESDRQAALALARLLVEDASISVREALSKELRNCRFLPQDIITKLCSDLDQVAMPFVVASQAVSDEFLETLVPDATLGVQEAVAQREIVSEALSFAICDTADKEAVSTLMDNTGADVSERSGRRVIERFPEERSLLEQLAARSDLRLQIVEKLIFKVSRRFGEYLTERFHLAADYSSYLMALAQRQVFIDTLAVARHSEVHTYFTQLKSVGGITSDLMLSLVQAGALDVFVMALAALVNKDHEAVGNLINRGSNAALMKLLEAAGFSKSVSGAIGIAFQRHFRG